MTLDEIREAINVRYELNFNNRSDLHDHLLIGGFLHRNKDKIPKGEFDKIRALMLNFTVSANILALRLIYHKYDPSGKLYNLYMQSKHYFNAKGKDNCKILYINLLYNIIKNGKNV